MMYVEYWCEEHLNSLTLGSPDFSHIEMVSPLEILCAIPIWDRVFVFVFPAIQDHVYGPICCREIDRH
jgi:hypothetical protein